MALAYWGYGKDYDPANLSEELREQLIATINLMNEWSDNQLGVQRNMLKFKDEQAKDLKEKLGEAMKKIWLLEQQIENMQQNIRTINNL